MMFPEFGDRVRIRTNGNTEELGLAGRTSLIYGFTTPSLTLVEVIGGAVADKALSVKIDGDNEPQLWLNPEFVEFVDHAPGTTLQIGRKSFVREADGSWRETRQSPELYDK
jgi:hypothetical protein